jgi:hypothetical protein
MKDKSKKKTFSTMEEYRAYYQASPEKKNKTGGSKYYRLGTEIAILASKETMHDSARTAGRPD